jgi:hypothetical protein
VTAQQANEGGRETEGHGSRHTGKPSRRWPDGRPLCGADKGFDVVSERHSGYCKRTAGEQTGHYGIGSCKWHGGATKTHQVAAERVLAERAAEKLLGRLRRFDEFDGADIDYRLESLRLIAFWKHRASMYGGMIAAAESAAERLKQAHEAEALVLGNESDDEAPALQAAREDLRRIFTTGGVTAYVGHQWDADRHGRIYAVSEGVRALVKLEREALGELRSAIALAKDLKVADAQIDLAKLVGGMLLAVVMGVLAELERLNRIVAPIEDSVVLELIAQQLEVVGGRSVSLASVGASP